MPHSYVSIKFPALNLLLHSCHKIVALTQTITTILIALSFAQLCDWTGIFTAGYAGCIADLVSKEAASWGLVVSNKTAPLMAYIREVRQGALVRSTLMLISGHDAYFIGCETYNLLGSFGST